MTCLESFLPSSVRLWHIEPEFNNRSDVFFRKEHRMKVRTLAGLGMTLLAAGLMTIYFLNPDFPGGVPSRSDGDAQENPEDQPAQDSPDEVAEFLASYNATYRSLWTDAATADWTSRTNVKRENSHEAREARNRLADFTGGSSGIQTLQLYRDRLDLNDVQDRQIDKAWQLAAHGPGSSGAGSMADMMVAALDSMKTFRFPKAHL